MPDGSQVYSTIPIILRGGVFVDIDNTRAIGGLFTDAYRVLLLGQKLAAGSAAANTPVRVPSATVAAQLFGINSMLHIMAKRIFDQAKFMGGTLEVWAIASPDGAGAAAAAGSVVVGGAPTANGTIAFYIGGERVAVGVMAGQSTASIATALVAAINGITTNQYVAAAVDGVNTSKVNLTALQKGLVYNGIDLRHSYFRGEALPPGLTLAITAMATGATNPDITAAIAAMGPTRWAKIAMPFNDGANVTLLENEMLRRFGATIQLEGVVHGWLNDTLANLLTFGAARDSAFISWEGGMNVPAPTFALAARYTALAAVAAIVDAPRQLRSLIMANELPPAEIDRLDADERESLLADGIATFTVGDDGLMRMERNVTTYKTNGAGVLDPSYRDVETMECLHSLRADIRGYVLTTYPRSKLADDGPGVTASQVVVTPKYMRSALAARGFLWAQQGLIEDYQQFLADLAVSRDANDPDRLNALIRPNIINNFRTLAAELQFIL